MLRYALVLLAGLWAAAPASAGSFDALFDELSKDFGSVPRGPALTHHFRVTNNTGSPVHIAGVRMSCNCVSAWVLQNDLAPGQSTSILAQMDTTRFSGTRSVTIYVQFDRPHWEEVRLLVMANARDDLTVSPESLALGQAKRGSMPSGSVTITFQGNSDWQITELQRESNYVLATLKELRRQGSEVSYQLTAKIRADAPVGKWFTDVWLKTNNPAMPRVRVPLTVEIESALSVSPSTVVLGQLKPGAEAERRVIVRGVKPFKITQVEGADGELTVKDSTEDSKPIHVLTVRLKPSKPGEFNRTLKIVTDLKDDSAIEFQAKAQVAEAGS
jgi:Protein of unknown function (DUF1573)